MKNVSSQRSKYRKSGLVILTFILLFIAFTLTSCSSSARSEALESNVDIWIAAETGNLARVKQLIESGTDVNVKDNWGWTPLYKASKNGHLDIVKYLVSLGVDVNAGMIGSSPLHWAVKEDQLDVVKFLVSVGADVNVKIQSGNTPMAIENGYDAVAGYLRSVEGE